MFRPDRDSQAPRARRGSGPQPYQTLRHQTLRHQTLRHQTLRDVARRGFTLVELLVVVFVVLAITAIAIGVVAPDTRTKAIRDAARQINAHIQGAKALAAESGRPVAVVFEPDTLSTPAHRVRVLKYAEVPPPYAGDSLFGSVALFTHPGPGAIDAYGVVRVSDSGWIGVVKPGDLVQFNRQGHVYVIVAVDTNNLLWRILPALGGTTTVVRNPSSDNNAPMNLPYQVFRQPQPSSVASLELPESVVVDLGQSGPEGGVFPAVTAANPLTIVFSPGGSVLRFTANGVERQVSGPLYLMVGKVENVVQQTTANLGASNAADLETIWVAINHQTGLVTSVKNAGGDNLSLTVPKFLNEAREFARRAQSLGGR